MLFLLFLLDAGRGNAAPIDEVTPASAGTALVGGVVDQVPALAGSLPSVGDSPAIPPTPSGAADPVKSAVRGLPAPVPNVPPSLLAPVKEAPGTVGDTVDTATTLLGGAGAVTPPVVGTPPPLPPIGDVTDPILRSAPQLPLSLTTSTPGPEAAPPRPTSPHLGGDIPFSAFGPNEVGLAAARGRARHTGSVAVLTPALRHGSREVPTQPARDGPLQWQFATHSGNSPGSGHELPVALLVGAVGVALALQRCRRFAPYALVPLLVPSSIARPG